MKHTFYFIISILTSTCLYHGCGDDPVKSGGGNNNIADTSILRTDEFGNILYGDTTDWCYNNPPPGFSFFPAYPNPCTGIIYARFYIPADDTIKLYIKESSGTEHVYVNSYLMAGTYTYTIKDTINEFRNTYQRLYITSKLYQQSAYCRFYGDIRFAE